jgi:hypothetical protein
MFMQWEATGTTLREAEQAASASCQHSSTVPKTCQISASASRC